MKNPMNLLVDDTKSLQELGINDCQANDTGLNSYMDGNYRTYRPDETGVFVLNLRGCGGEFMTVRTHFERNGI